MRLTTEIIKFEHGCANIGVKVESNRIDDAIKPAHYVAILRAMRDTDKNAFYAAMCQFVDEGEMKSVSKWLSEQCDESEGEDE